MSNREIRAQARRLFRENIWMILAASAIYTLPNSLNDLLDLYVKGREYLFPFIAVAFARLLLILPRLLVGIGLPHLALDVRHGSYLSLWTMILSDGGVTYLTEGFLEALILGAAWTATNAIAWLLDSAAVSLFLALPILCLAIWLVNRICLTFACAILHPDLAPHQCVIASWRATRGNILRILGNDLVLNLPYLLILIGLKFLPLPTPVTLTLTTLTSILFTGYIILATYSLYETLLSE